MKGINFITSLSQKEQYAIRRWFIFTILLAIVALVSVGYVQLKQLARLFEVKNEKKQLAHHEIAFQASNTRKEKLQAQVSAQKSKLAKITKHQTHPKNPLTILNTITAACTKTNVQLQSLTITKQNVEFIGNCAQPEHALAVISNLNESSLFQNSKLVSLQPSQLHQDKNRSGLICTIMGIIKKQ
jgi:hypothetical protein